MNSAATALPPPICEDSDAWVGTKVRRKRPGKEQKFQAAFDEAVAVASPGASGVTVDAVLRYVGADVPTPCRDAFDSLAETEPAHLAAWIFSGPKSVRPLSRAHLSYAAEALGRATEGVVSPVLVGLLEQLLRNESPLVREGTIYGLAFHRSPHIDRVLRTVAENDASPGVREAAAEVLEEE